MLLLDDDVRSFGWVFIRGHIPVWKVYSDNKNHALRHLWVNSRLGIKPTLHQLLAPLALWGLANNATLWEGGLSVFPC